MGADHGSELAELEAQRERAVAERQQAAAALRTAEQARERLDGTDVEAWRKAEAAVAAARSESERCDRAVVALSRRCGDAAEAIARGTEAAVEAEADANDAEAAEHRAALAALAEQREAIDTRLEEARETVRAARLPYLPPASPEYRAHEQRERQRRERLEWHVKNKHRDSDLSPRDLAWVEERRAQLRREADQARERLIEHAGAGVGPYRLSAGAGQLDEHGLPLERIEQLDVV
jgi:hypothetical protein